MLSQDYVIGVVKGEIHPDNEKTDESKKKNDPLYVLDVSFSNYAWSYLGRHVRLRI